MGFTNKGCGESKPNLASTIFVNSLKALSDTYILTMALIPRLQLMTDSSKAMIKRPAITLLVVLVGLTLLRAIFPWILLGLALYGAWCMLNRK